MVFARILNRLFGSGEKNENVVGGAGEVFSAIIEHSDDGKRYLVELGEPQLVDRGGQFKQDFMVQIPTSTGVNEPEPPNIEYNLPEGEDVDSPLYKLLDLFSIETVADLEKLDGENVMATFEDGTLSLRFDLLEKETAE